MTTLSNKRIKLEFIVSNGIQSILVITNEHYMICDVGYGLFTKYIGCPIHVLLKDLQVKDNRFAFKQIEKTNYVHPMFPDEVCVL